MLDLVATAVGGLLATSATTTYYSSYYRPMIDFAARYFTYPIRCAEIGVQFGLNSKRILDALPVETMYLIDPYEKYDEYDFAQVMINASGLDQVLNYLELYRDCIIPLQMRSEDALSFVHDLDLVYIDGNHAKSYVKKDLQYWGKLRYGGIMGGHDITMTDVHEAVSEFSFEKNSPVYVEGNEWWVIKDAT